MIRSHVLPNKPCNRRLTVKYATTGYILPFTFVFTPASLVSFCHKKLTMLLVD